MFTFFVGALVLLLSWASPYDELEAVAIGITVVVTSALWAVAIMRDISAPRHRRIRR